MIHQLLENAETFNSVCEYLGTSPAYYNAPEELATDFSLKEISMALNEVVDWEDIE